MLEIKKESLDNEIKIKNDNVINKNDSKVKKQVKKSKMNKKELMI